MRNRRWRAISLAMTIERERRSRAMKKARASVADRAPMRRHRRARPSAVMARSSWTSGEHSQQLPQTSPRTQRRSKGGHAWINSIDFELELTVIF